uniref:C2H2-type domain-containing protein n=1 Tax=viral metagenome TaxID=1070528 RepID=A0A6C0EDD4_9ZZZZ
MLDLHNHMCLICNINYASRQSLCNHNKKFHRKNNLNNYQFLANVNHNIITCKWCYKVLSCRQSKYRHQLICKDNKLKEENLLLKKENKILQKISNNNCNNNIINNNNK